MKKKEKILRCGPTIELGGRTQRKFSFAEPMEKDWSLLMPLQR
jgi:hypothetical protein